MPIDEELTESLELCGFVKESRLMNILAVILRLQEFPPIPLTFAEIYEQFLKEEPSTKLTKAWVHRVLKSLVDSQLIRVENPKSHRKRYIADVNTIVTGLERLKSTKVVNLETRGKEIDEELTKVTALDCGYLSKELVEAVTGRQEELSSRIVRGVEELHRVLRYNMLDNAGRGDIIRATALWMGPFMDNDVVTRTMRFAEAAERGADIRYLISTDFFNLERDKGVRFQLKEGLQMLEDLGELRKRGKKFDIRLYAGPNTYNQISFNRENMALVITENPMTATWISRRFNPDLIDNAVKTFDKDWKMSKSIFDLTVEDILKRMGVAPEELIRLLMSHEKEDNKKG
jgi:Fe2+ or Zn2+ uptake regulation protein